MTRGPLSRRAVLRGLGASLALPMMQAMVPAARASTSAPLRTLVFFVPSGMRPANFWPTVAGDLTSSPVLAPLAPWASTVTVLRGTANRIAAEDNGEPHATCTTGLLSNQLSSTTVLNGPILGHQTFDQLLATEIGSATRLRSLALGSEAGRTACPARDCIYSRFVSWNADGSPVTKDVSPANVYQRLVGGDLQDAVAAARAKARRTSVLDRIGADAQRLSAALGAEDRARLDQYLTSVQEVERQLAFAGACDADASGIESLLVDGAGLSQTEHIQLMLDLIVLTLQCDDTRIITYMLGNGGSNRTLPELGLTRSHHEAGHFPDDPDAAADTLAYERWEAEQLAYLLGRMAATPDGNGSLLDHTQILFLGGLSEPSTHYPIDLPVVIAGGAGGRHVGQGLVTLPSERPIADLYLNLMAHHGIERSTFGAEGTGPIAGLFG